MVFGGYLRSVDRLMEDVPWVGWLAVSDVVYGLCYSCANLNKYLTPVLYAYEIIMGMEFHGRDFNCAPASIIPSGPDYNDQTLQSCASTGVRPGELSLNGDDYISSEFGFSFNNLGRDFGILMLFTVGFLVINMILVEKIDWAPSGGGALKFTQKKGAPKAGRPTDEESIDDGATTPVAHTDQFSKEGKGLVKSGSTFTWRDLNYIVPYKDGEKQLLNGVSGYCEPGKLTALVGASGAGKSTRTLLSYLFLATELC